LYRKGVKTNMDDKLITNHPSRYNREGRKECIDEMVDIFGLDATIQWSIMTAYKYRYRLGLKDDAKLEMAKIKWYEDWVYAHLTKRCTNATNAVVFAYFHSKEQE